MPTVWLNDCDPVGLACTFHPVSATACSASPGAEMVRYGQVLWASRTLHGDIAVAWDWVELPEKIIAMADPMQILSNVQLKLDDGSWMNERHRILWLNDLLGALPWQAELAAPGSRRGSGSDHRLAA
jgi:hypothetical protein